MKIALAIIVLVFMVHGVVAYTTSPHCSNYQNRGCAAAVWKVWVW